MKHNVQVTLVLLGLFILAQLVGLVIIDHYNEKDLPYGIEKPDYKPETSFIPLSVFIIIATVLALILARFKAVFLWKLWFLFAVIFGLSISFSVFSAIILLILISIYDMYAVWKSKHMIKLAKFQSKLKTFAGLFIPYEKNKAAILGGGDIAFPLLFAGVVLLEKGLYPSILIIVYSALALFLLFLFGKKKKFYPAMPFISLGCFLGYLVSLI